MAPQQAPNSIIAAIDALKESIDAEDLKGPFPRVGLSPTEPLNVTDYDTDISKDSLLRTHNPEAGVRIVLASDQEGEWIQVGAKGKPLKTLGKSKVAADAIAILPNFTRPNGVVFNEEPATVKPKPSDPRTVDIMVKNKAVVPSVNVAVAAKLVARRWEATVTEAATIWKPSENENKFVDLSQVPVRPNNLSATSRKGDKTGLARSKILGKFNVTTVLDLANMLTAVTGSTGCEIGIARLFCAYVMQLPNKQLATRGKTIMTRAMAIVDAVEASEINLDAIEGTAKERGTRIFDSVYPLPSQAGRGVNPRSNLGRPPPRPSQKRPKSKRLAPSEACTDPDPPPREGAATQLALTDGTRGGGDDDSMNSLSEAEAEPPRLNTANAVAKRRRTDPIDVEPASDEESIIPYEQPASGVEECESCDDDFEGIIPRKWKGEHKTRKLELLAKILEVSAADAAGMLASAAGRATDGGGDWNASVHMLAMQAAVDYVEAKARCRSRIPSLDLDNDPDNWQHALKKIFAMKPSQAAPKGTRENAPPCNHAKIVGVSSENPRYLGAATAADIDVLTSAEAFRAERESAPDEHEDHDRIKLALFIHGAAGWCIMYSNGFARDRSGSQKVPATLVTTCARFSTTVVRMITARSVGDSTRLFEASIKERESVRRGVIMGIFELKAIVIALGGRVPEEDAVETSGPGETPFEQGELGSMRADTLPTCVERALKNLEELLYYAHVKVGGAIDHGSASELGLVDLWKRTSSRFEFGGREGHCGRYLIELALRKLGEAIRKKRTEATTDPLDLYTPVRKVSTKEFDEVAGNVRFGKYATRALAAAAATGITGDNMASAARKRPAPKTSAAPPPPQHAAKWAKHEHSGMREQPAGPATSARMEPTQQAAQPIVYTLKPNTILHLLPPRHNNKREGSAINALETLIKESPARGIGPSDHASGR